MDSFEKLLNKTYRYLSYRPRSEKEVHDYLKKKKSDDISTAKIIENLKKNKFLDDVEFAKWWIEQRSTIKPKSSRIIKLELKQKGIVQDLITQLFEDEELNSDFDKALDLANRRIKRYKGEERQKIFEKMGRFLASKGFDWDTVKKVLDITLPKS